MSKVVITTVRGAAVADHITALAALRIAVFLEWPYLYDGDESYEAGYLKAYAECPDSVVVLAHAGPQLLGASTGLPLKAAAEEFRKPFTGTEFARSSIFYFGESVLLPTYRGAGIGHQFFDLREAAARSGGFEYAAFCAVHRSDEDPRRPAGARDHSEFWTKRGYGKMPAIEARFSWKEIGAKAEKDNSLTFWLKAL